MIVLCCAGQLVEGGRGGRQRLGREEGGVREELSLSSMNWAGVRRREGPKYHCWPAG